jgi:Putative DNA-binding domain
MLPIRFEDIGPADILRLLEDRTSERKILEYKQALNIGPDNDRAEFLADISSFANASGGDIIFGIADERDDAGKATGAPEAITPLTLGNPIAECSRIEQIIESGIEPRIPVVLVRPIDIPEQGLVIVMRVGKSWLAPHMVSFKNRTRFYSRNGYGKVQLDVQQIGAAFSAQRSFGERLRAWKADRIAKAIAGEGPIPMDGPFVLYHFVSTAALTDEQTPPRVFAEGGYRPMYALMGATAQLSRYNADGLLLDTGRLFVGSRSYLQIFRDGSLEYGDSSIVAPLHNRKVASQSFEEALVKTFNVALKVLKELETSEPIFASLTLIGVKGIGMSNAKAITTPGEAPKVFDRDVITSPDVLIQNTNEGAPFPTSLLPIVNSVWQASGFPGTIYLRDGKWDPNVFV